MEALSVLLFSVPYGVVMLLGLLLPLLGYLVFQRFAVGVLLACVGFILSTLTFQQFSFKLGINWYLPDFSIGLLALVALLRIVFLPAVRPRHWGIYVLLAVFAVNLAQGLVVYGSAAGPSSRPTFYGLAACAYALSFRADARYLRGAYNGLIWLALFMLALAVYRGLVTALDIRDLLPPSGSFQPAGHSVWRVIVSYESLVVAQAMLALAGFVGVSSGWAPLRYLAPLLLLATVALQHRSVWLAALAGYFSWKVGLAKRWSDVRQLAPVLVVLAALALGLGLAVRSGGGGAGVGGDVVKSARDAAELKGTAGERLGSWQQLFKTWQAAGPRAWAIGNPFGTSIERYASDDLGARRIAYQPHNYYVELLTTQGLISFVAYMALFAAALRGLWRLRHHPEVGTAARWLLTMVVSQMAYYLTYGVDYMQGLMLGVALSLVAAHAPARLRKAAWRHPATLPAASRPRPWA